MTAYLMTEEQHAELLSLTYGYCHDDPMCKAWEMLKAMKPQTPSAWLACDKEGNVGCSTKENHALRCCEAGTRAEPLYTLGDSK